MIDLQKSGLLKKQAGGSLLGLALDGNRLEAVVLRRTNGSAEIKQTMTVSLSLDPLTNDPELVGRELQKHLESAGIRERRCAVCVPLNWALTLQVKLPDLPPGDAESFLEIEAERGFPNGIESLMLAQSRYRAPGGETHAMLVAVSRDHVTRLEHVLRAAQLRPVSFSLGITALQGMGGDASDGLLALVPGENHIGLQVTSGGGVAALRALEGALETEGGQKLLHADVVARELRITLGQLPGDVRDRIRQVRVYGRSEIAQQLTEEVRARLEPIGMNVEQVTAYGAESFGVRLPQGAVVTPALSLAFRHLAGQAATFEFLPPKVSQWKQLTARYSSGKLVWSGAAAGAVAAAIALAFLGQQWLLWRWESKWNTMKPRVTQLQDMQLQIRKYRPWFDDSFGTLNILRRLTEAFPEEGSVSAKTVEIRERATVTCTGSARNNQALLQTVDKLSAAPGVSGVHIEQTRGASPLQFTFSFQWGEGTGQ